MAKLDRLLKFTVKSGASDLHISVTSEPLVRLYGTLRKVKHDVLSAEASEAMLFEILTDEQRERLRERHSIDAGYELEGVGRFRCNIYRQRLGYAGVFRVVPGKVPTLEELGMPPVVRKLLNFRQGLVLVTGPAGCGKTTTLGGMIHYLNNARQEHIITVEDPIEIVHGNANCIVNQREVRRHTESFHVALRAALREDPDIILIGEMRDLETISMGITSAETGHLVLGTLHTTSASRTVSRLVDVFPPEQMAQIRAMVSESIRGVISQRLLPRKDDSGMVAALEIMVATAAIANLIRENRTFQIPSQMQIGVKQGMRLMDDSLMDLVRDDVIEIDEAIECAEDKPRFVMEKAKRVQAEQNPDDSEADESDVDEPDAEQAEAEKAAPKSWKQRLLATVDIRKDKDKAKVEAAAEAAADEPADAAPDEPLPGPAPKYVDLFERTTDTGALAGAYRDFQREVKSDADSLLRALCAWHGDAAGMRAPSFVLAVKDAKARADLRARVLWRLETSGDWQDEGQLRSGPICRTIVACQDKKRRDLVEAIERFAPEGLETHLKKIMEAV